MVFSRTWLLSLALSVGFALPIMATAQEEPALSEDQLRQFLLTTRVVASKHSLRR